MSYGVGPLLLAAVAGYWVLERAETHKGRLRKIGQLLGGLIILVSLVGVVCRVWCLAMCPTGYGPMGKAGKGWFCPYNRQTSPPQLGSQ